MHRKAMSVLWVLLVAVVAPEAASAQPASPRDRGTEEGGIVDTSEVEAATGLAMPRPLSTLTPGEERARVRRSIRRQAGLGTAGLVLGPAALAGGAVLSRRGRGAEDDCPDTTLGPCFDGFWEQVGGGMLLGVGTVLTLGGMVLAALAANRSTRWNARWDAEDDAPQLGVRAWRRGGGLVVRGSL